MTIIPGSKAILGFSGGVDSVVLSHWLLQRYNIRPYLLHVNYGLREEADEDERWCRWFAGEHRFEIEVLHADPKRRKGEKHSELGTEASISLVRRTCTGPWGGIYFYGPSP